MYTLFMSVPVFLVHKVLDFISLSGSQNHKQEVSRASDDSVQNFKHTNTHTRTHERLDIIYTHLCTVFNKIHDPKIYPVLSVACIPIFTVYVEHSLLVQQLQPFTTVNSAIIFVTVHPSQLFCALSHFTPYSRQQ